MKDIFQYKAIILKDDKPFQFVSIESDTTMITNADRRETYPRSSMNDIDVFTNSDNLIQFIK